MQRQIAAIIIVTIFLAQLVYAANPDISILGPIRNSNLGRSLLLADINGDGRDDFIVPSSISVTKIINGKATVVSENTISIIYSYEGMSSIDLKNTHEDVTIHTESSDTDKLGVAIAAGDINNDGKSDLIIGAVQAKANNVENAGKVFVIYGRDFPSGTDIDLDHSTSGITILGSGSPLGLGRSLSVGDVNGDGNNDLIIGVVRRGARFGAAGEIDVIYGRQFEPGTVINLKTEQPDLKIKTNDPTDNLGFVLDSADVNNDGFADILIGASTAKTPSGMQAGAVYIVYGKNFEPHSIIDLSQTSTTKIYGAKNGDNFGSAIATGHINNDDKLDIIIGAPLATVLDERPISGAGYVIYGKDFNETTIIDLAETQANITIIGRSDFGSLGSALATGKINNDRMDDIVIADDVSLISKNEVDVVYGHQYNEPTIIDLASDNSDAFKKFLPTSSTDDGFGHKVAVGNFDNDELADIAISAWLASPSPDRQGAGTVYGIAGKNFATFNPTGRPLPAQAQKPKTFNLANFLSGFFFFIFRR